MNMSKTFILILILVAVGVAVLLINYIKQPSQEIQPIKFLTEIPEEEKIFASEEVKIVEIKKIKDEIMTIAEGEIIKYQETSFYSKGDFAVILENQAEFKNQSIDKFKKKIIGVTAEDCKVDLDDSKKSAVLKCDIKGARYGTNSYNMHFLLGNWPFDLYQLKREEKKLVYEGKIDDVPTEVVFEFLYRLSHCHEHVWPK